MAACGIAPEDDDGNRASQKKAEKATLDNKRLQGAIEKILAGQYTTQQLLDTFALTQEQINIVDKAIADA